MTLSNITAKQLREAANIATEIERLQARLEKLLTGRGGRRVGRPPKSAAAPEGAEEAAVAPKKKRALTTAAGHAAANLQAPS